MLLWIINLSVSMISFALVHMNCAMIQYNSLSECLVSSQNTSHLILFQQREHHRLIPQISPLKLQHEVNKIIIPGLGLDLGNNLQELCQALVEEVGI